MINKIIDGICIRINEAFGDEKTIYTESVKQGLKEPCFFVSCVNPISKQVLGNRYFRNNLFCIQYFPATDEPKAECNEVHDGLILTLEYITVDGSLTRGTKMRGEIADEVLTFFVNFDMFVYKADESTPMEELVSDIAVKG